MSLLTHGAPSLSIHRARLHSNRFVFQSLTHTKRKHKLQEKKRMQSHRSMQEMVLFHKAWSWTCFICLQFCRFYLACACKKEIVFYSHHFINILFYEFRGYTPSLPICTFYLHVPILRKYFSIHITSSILTLSLDISHLTFLISILTTCLI
jgi:hypothetical protein